MVLIAVTVCGAAVMGLEMMAFRVLPPNFGSSLYVWGSIISVFLTALTAGYFFGGVLADQRPHLSSLGVLALLAGLLVLPIPAVQQPLAEWVLARIESERWAALLYALLLFGPSTMLLGGVSPLAVRLASRSLEGIGRVAGRLYALSTAGSILGTLGTAFYWMDVAGVRAITASLGWVLVFLGGIMLLLSRRTGSPQLGVLCVAIACVVGTPAAQAETKTLFRRDTTYHHIVVEDNGKWRELKFDRASQSGILRSDPLRSKYAYTDAFHLAPVYCPGMQRVLFIGGGAATGPKQFRHFYPKVQIDVVEIDPVVMEVAQRFFSFKPDTLTNVTIRDGRRFLVTTRHRYDAIVIDAYYADSIPFHVTTMEFMQLVQRRLNPGGVAILNVIGSLTGAGSQLVRSEYKTVSRVFRSCGVFPILETGEQPDDFSRTAVRNVMLVAADAALSPLEVRKRVGKVHGTSACRI